MQTMQSSRRIDLESADDHDIVTATCAPAKYLNAQKALGSKVGSSYRTKSRNWPSGPLSEARNLRER